MARITITLTERAKKALIEYAQHEIRDPRAQAAIIIVSKLRHLGFLGKSDQVPDVVELEDLASDLLKSKKG